MSKWIPTSERLPHRDAKILITTQWGQVTIAEYYRLDETFWLADEGDYYPEDITAWMPLPKPYKGDEKI